ncbi:hypothetical protein [Bdellovibrio bacteriovorus]|uniref:hypothetical protein n=1 Tax=Bdellovibrio bacteriovorus TaxID=959 RepID=UPI0035A65537
MTQASDLALDLFKDLVWDSLISAALKQLFAAFPMLGFGPIGLFVTWVVTNFADKLYDRAKEYIALETIAFKNKQLEKEYNRESVKLKIIARGSGIDSEEFKQGRENAKKTMSNVVRFDVARSA